MATRKSSNKDFSMIAFFDEFQKELKKVNVHPLTIDNLHIFQSNYRQLARLEDEAEEYSEDFDPWFAELSHKTKDTEQDLRFNVLFGFHGVLFQHEMSVEPSFFDLGFFAESGGLSSRELAIQFVHLMELFVSGEIGVYMTKYKGRYCSSELVLFAPKQKPYAILTWAKFPWWTRNKTKPEDYSVEVLRNRIPLQKRRSYSKNFIFFDIDEATNLPVKRGRVISGEVEPLTKSQYEAFVNDFDFQLAGKPEDQSKWYFLFLQWELWIGLALLNLLLFYGVHTDWLPNFITDYTMVLTFINVAAFIWALMPLLAYKEKLKKSGHQNLYISIDKVVSRIFPRYLFSLALVLIGSTLFFRIFALEGSKSFYTFFDIAPAHKWSYVIPVLFLLSFVLVFSQKTLARLLAHTLTLSGIILLFVLNSMTDTSVDTPEFYTMIAIVLYVLSIIINLAMIYQYSFGQRLKIRLISSRDELNE